MASSSKTEWTLYFSITVPFIHLANFRAMMEILNGQVESCFVYLDDDADIKWVVRTDYDMEAAVEHLRDHCQCIVEIHETLEAAEEAAQGAEWTKGLAIG